MTDDSEREVYRALRTSQDKYVYFLLAAAGAAIALAVNQTRDAPLNWSQVPLAAGVLSWAASFFCGCRHLVWVKVALYNNAELLRAESGRHKLVGSNPHGMVLLSETIRTAIESNSDRASSFVRWQFGLFISGGLFYIGWHVLEMYQRTPA